MNHRHIVALAATLFSLSAFAEERTLKIAHFLPASAPAQKQVLEPWCEEMEKLSDGQIKCQFYPAMQLGGTPAKLAEQVKHGVADVVWTAPGYSAGRFPAIEAFELPFMIKDPTSGSKALWQFWQQHAQDEFADYKVLAFHTDGGQAVHTADKAVVDLDGLKLRISTRVGAKTLTALGGQPVAMPPAQVTEAITKGVVDGSFAAWELVYPTKLSEVTQYHLQPAAGAAWPTATVLMVLMNKRKYETLPAELKAIVDKTTGEALVGRFASVWEAVSTDTKKRVLEQGNQITTLDATQIAAMKKATADVEQEWIEQVAGRGLDGKKLIAAARALAGTND